jgi:peptide-methionine (S)-S-oxide reductase
MFLRSKTQMVDPAQALAGRADYAFPVPDVHAVNGHSIKPPFPDGTQIAYFAMGCFWGAERVFWQTPGVYSTAVGYTGGYTPFPTYDETCSNLTGHAETVMVVFDPAQVSYAQLLQTFFEEHDPTQGMRQGNDIGTTYRSAIFTTSDDQAQQAQAARDAYSQKVKQAGFGGVTTEIAPAGPFYYAEDYHQQYLHKVPNGYCGLEGTGVSCPVGLFAGAQPSS